jgi:hypothetical protein
MVSEISMGKSRAEIQRAYRQRLIERNKEENLRKERERKRRNYVSSHQLSDNDRKERNRRNRTNLREFYARQQAEPDRQDSSVTSGYESRGNGEESGVETSDKHQTRSRGNEQGRGRLLVRMHFNEIIKGKRKVALKRWKRDMTSAVSRNRILEQERDRLRTNLKSTQRALQSGKKAQSKVKMKEEKVI